MSDNLRVVIDNVRDKIRLIDRIMGEGQWCGFLNKKEPLW
jgi:hypothetical protein